ncbi:hypothetical protein RB195_025015 [Necator americanus]|uniref:Transthyretin-like family protein n=1 Tax=Necator americanus TaxID=51031 RepID=A0ABR1EQS8_NECAM
MPAVSGVYKIAIAHKRAASLAYGPTRSGQYGNINITDVTDITDQSAGDKIGNESARPLCIRIKGQVNGKDKSRESTTSGTHPKRKHDRINFEISVQFLPQLLAFVIDLLTVVTELFQFLVNIWSSGYVSG